MIGYVHNCMVGEWAHMHIYIYIYIYIYITQIFYAHIMDMHCAPSQPGMEVLLKMCQVSKASLYLVTDFSQPLHEICM